MREKKKWKDGELNIRRCNRRKESKRLLSAYLTVKDGYREERRRWESGLVF